MVEQGGDPDGILETDERLVPDGMDGSLADRTVPAIKLLLQGILG